MGDSAMELRPLGKTGRHVSLIGFGAFKIGRNKDTKYSANYDLPSREDVFVLIDNMLELGINVIDTAPAYGESEKLIGAALAANGHRSRITLCTKVGETFGESGSTYAYDRDSVNASIDRSLRRLETDSLDVVCVHSNGDDLKIIDQTDVLETLDRRRSVGDIKHIGFSGKTSEGHLRALDHDSGIEVLMVELNPDSTSQLEIVKEAGRRSVGVLVKKGLSSGRVDPARSLPWLASMSEISSIVIGSLSPLNMTRNVAHTSPDRGSNTGA
jgi:aryl-alcohol dehydrogenase-like predicted oxidoreductase